jgi:hypothetical protein
MHKCPIHDFPRNIVINNFYARLLGYYKDYLDGCFDGSFTSKDVDTKWDLLETIQNNIEGWDSDKVSLIALSLSLKLLIFKSIVVSMVLILKL